MSFSKPSTLIQTNKLKKISHYFSGTEFGRLFDWVKKYDAKGENIALKD